MKKFEEAKVEVIKFAVEDIITESTGGSTGGGDVGGAGDTEF